MNRLRLTTRDLCTIGMFTAIVAVLSQISIPLPYGVPLTLQTFAVPLAGVILGKRQGTLAITLYVLLGAVGVPVFSGFGGGMGRILGVTGGFILSFPLMAYLAGMGVQKGTLPWLVGGLALSYGVTYMIGPLYYMVVTGNTLESALMACVLPFIPGDIIKALIVGTAGVKSRHMLVGAGYIEG